MLNRVIAFFKKETVLCVSLLMAVVSAFIVPPDKGGDESGEAGESKGRYIGLFTAGNICFFGSAYFVGYIIGL
ncbi:MAG: hypothetical protein K2K54_12815 [Lachnospiraceae bacterium]|nr:hypothetical protein [Lachnospiraceae bacterium]